MTEPTAPGSRRRLWAQPAWIMAAFALGALGLVTFLAARQNARFRPVIALLEGMSSGSRAEREESRRSLLRDPVQNGPLLVRILRRGKSRWHKDILPWLDAIPTLARQRSRQLLLERNAIDALQRMGPAAAPALLPLLADARSGGRDAAIPLLRTYGTAALPTITGALEDPRATSRAGAALALARFPSSEPAVLKGLIRARQDPVPDVRIAGLWGLGQLLDRGATVVPELVEALRDPDAGVQLQAVQSLRFFRAEASPAVTSLRQMLREAPADQRAEAAMVLAAIGTPAQAAAEELVLNLRAAEPRPARQAAAALIELGLHRDESLARLKGFLEDRDLYLRIRTLDVLGGLGPKAQALVPTLLALLENSELRDDRPTVNALRTIDASAIPERFRIRRAPAAPSPSAATNAP